MSTLETVCRDTPAARATSLTVTVGFSRRGCTTGSRCRRVWSSGVERSNPGGRGDLNVQHRMFRTVSLHREVVKGSAMAQPSHQPYLHGHLTCVAAPATWLSGPSGQLVDGADGLYVNDRRILSRLVVTVDGVSPEPLSARTDGASAADFHGVLRKLGDPGPDPTVTMHRRRRVEPSGGTETLTLVNRARAPITATVAVEAAADFAPMGLVKDGRTLPVVSGWRADDGATVSVDVSPAPLDAALRWR